jgi:hypothetical protein
MMMMMMMMMTLLAIMANLWTLYPDSNGRLIPYVTTSTDKRTQP